MKKFIRNGLRKYFLKLLGIEILIERINCLERTNKQLIDRHTMLENTVIRVHKDNQVILDHVKMINKDFSVAADISFNKYEPTVVIVMRRYQGQQDVIKTYTFNNNKMEHIHHFLSGFGEDNVRIDQGPRRSKGPDYLY